MTLVRRTNPLGQIIALRQAMDRRFDDPFVRSRGTALGADNRLALDVRQTADRAQSTEQGAR